MKLSRSSTLGLAALLALAACHPSRDNAQGESAGGENAAGATEQADSRASAGETAPNGDAEAARTPLHAPPDVAAPPANAQRTASGLASRVITPGDGAEHPTARSRVTVNYTGWTSDGHMFDSSISRGQPATFPLNGVIAGWTEGVQLMVTGETRRFWIPANLAYGDHPRAGAPQGMLVFDVQLIRFE